jgi:hypothetical protein
MEGGEKEMEIDIPVTTEEAKMLEAQGFRTSLPEPPSQISEDLRKELIRVLQAGDVKKKGAFTVSVAAHLERLVAAAKQILMAEKIAANDIRALLGQKKNYTNIYGQFGPAAMNPMMGSNDLEDSDDTLGMGTPFTGSMGKGAENFGVQVIKELLSAAKSFHDSPAKDVEALAVARHEGLTDVVAALETKLGISKPIADLPVIGDGSNGVIHK